MIKQTHSNSFAFNLCVLLWVVARDGEELLDAALGWSGRLGHRLRHLRNDRRLGRSGAGLLLGVLVVAPCS